MPFTFWACDYPTIYWKYPKLRVYTHNLRTYTFANYCLCIAQQGKNACKYPDPMSLDSKSYIFNEVKRKPRQGRQNKNILLSKLLVQCSTIGWENRIFIDTSKKSQTHKTKLQVKHIGLSLQLRMTVSWSTSNSQSQPA